MIVLIRHAHTDMAGHFCGHSDPPLSARGLAQLDELKAKVIRYRFTHIYSSDLQRARQTAESLASSYGVPVRVLQSLREIYFGGWEGLTWDEIAVRDPAYAQRWLDAYPNLAAPAGEDLPHFLRRIQDAMEVIADEVQDGCTAVVTHGGVIRTFLTNVVSPARALDLLECDYGSCWEVERHAGFWLANTASTVRSQLNRGVEAKR